MNRARSTFATKRPLSLFLGLTLSALGPMAITVLVPTSASAAEDGSISGAITNTENGEKLKGAIVVLQCTCLQGTRETRTNDQGLYAFNELPPGTYTVQVLFGSADISKVTTLPRGAKFRANFTVDPKNEFKRVIRVDARPVRPDTSVASKISMEEARNLPVSGNTSRDFTAVVEVAPTAGRDSAGISLAGTTGAESKYTVEGTNVNNPSFGTVGASIVQEFIEEVEVQESGYEAEFGGVAGGQVSARRLSGTNQLRGTARYTYTPRLAKPRFIQATDEALRVQLVPDYQMQGVVAMSGPIVKDKLYWSGGIQVLGTQSSLIQNFYKRVDKDGSGGYDQCPYQNGANDCVEGGNYIQTEQFGSQRFPTAQVGLGYFFGLDWAINPRHRIGATALGGPGFSQRSYRLGFRPGNFDPNAFGGNPTADPLGGGATVGAGVVNDHFGWDLDNQFTVTGSYLGRVADDKLEIDAGIGYSQFSSEDAWKLDDPSYKKQATTQERDANGASLYQLLDREAATQLVPGVKEACNAADLPPGLTCPVRQWLSGGIGEYDVDIARRVEGRLAFTHFFSFKRGGSHQLKYGTLIEHLERRSVFTYSGHNEPDFYDNCENGEVGGGEWCYQAGRENPYRVNRTQRVNNHRFVTVDSDDLDARVTRGFGRVRREEKDLRAISEAGGYGARVDSYDETLSTQNYGVYLQDRWAILSNLYLNAGVRWDMQDMKDIFGDRQIFIWDNVAPRVGVVYDWTDEGKSRLFASYGWFYQQLPLQLNNRAFGGLVQVRRSYRNADCEGQRTPNGDAKSDNGQPTEWCVDSPQLTTGLLAGAVVPNLKGQYNEQLQVGYEQEVIEDLVLGVRWLHTNLGRAVEDVSTDNGGNYIVANPGVAVSQSDIEARQAQCDDLQAQLDEFNATDPTSPDRQPVVRELQRCRFLVDAYNDINVLFDKPRRNFDAFTFEVKKRFAKNWLLLASYTYSRLVGNYDGFVDPTTGAINVGASTQYDLPELVTNSFGPLAFNVPHRFKVNGFYTFDLQEAGRLTLGTSLNVNSGFPVSYKADNPQYQFLYLVYLLPRGAGGQMQPNYTWNLSLSYSYPLPGRLELELAGRVLNVTNAKAAIRVDNTYTLDNARPIAGGSLEDLKHAKATNAGVPGEFFQRTVVKPQGNFGVETQFQAPLAAQFELIMRF